MHILLWRMGRTNMIDLGRKIYKYSPLLLGDRFIVVNYKSLI
jgi:hypothetical protein